MRLIPRCRMKVPRYPLFTYSGFSKVNLTLSARISKRFFVFASIRRSFVVPRNNNPVLAAKILNDFNIKEAFLQEKIRHRLPLIKANFKSNPAIWPQAKSCIG